MAFASFRNFLANAADQYAEQILETDRYRDAVKAALNDTKKWHQRECPLKAPLVIWLVLASVLHRAQSLASILKMLLSQYRRFRPDLSLRSITPEAAVKARYRLGPEPVAAVYRTLADDIRGTVAFHGLRLWSVDGTFLSMADTPENEEEFGRQKATRGRTAYPQLHLTSLIDTVTRQVKNAVIGRSDRVNERGDAMALLQDLGAGDLLLMDCGFSAAWFFDKCLDRKVHFLARISNCWKPTILKTYGAGDYLVQVSGFLPKTSADRGGPVTLKLRMIVYQVGSDEPVRLLTSLRGTKRYPADELALLYHERWESELTYDEQKVHLAALQHGKQRTVFRSKYPAGVRQEVYGLLITYNLVRGLMAEAAAATDLDPRHLSFVETIRLIDLATNCYQYARTRKEAAAIRRRLLTDIAETVNPHPRRPRHYPRVVKIKMSNYGCKNGTHRGCHRDYAAELWPVSAAAHASWSPPGTASLTAGRP